MKHNILLLCSLLLLAPARIFAQDSKMEVAVVGAPSLIFMYGNTIANHYDKPTIGFSAGASFQYNFTKLISLHTGLLYERKGFGAHVTYTDDQGNPTYTAYLMPHLDYLTVPLLARFTIGKKVKFIADAGPFVGFLVNPSAEYHLYGSGIVEVKSIDAGVSVGAGISIPIKERFAFNIEARNNTGLLNISKFPVIGDGSVKTNSTTLLLSFVYKIGSKKAAAKS